MNAFYTLYRIHVGCLVVGLFWKAHGLHINGTESRASLKNISVGTGLFQKPVGRKGTELYISYAAAYGGGGCFSSISQLGFLRGLDGAASIESDVATIERSVIATVSGGTWAVGMVAADQSLNPNPVSSSLGRQCMVEILHQKIPRSQWFAAFQKCGGCIVSPVGCINEQEHDKQIRHLFGVNTYCIADVSQTKMKDYVIKTNRFASMPWRKQRQANWEDFIYAVYLEDIGVKKNATVKKIFDRAYTPGSPPMYNKWGALWAVYEVTTDNINTLQIRPDHSYNPPPNLTLNKVLADSGAFTNHLTGQQAVQSVIAANPEVMSSIIRAQTKQGLIPWPFTRMDKTYLDSLPQTSEDISDLLQGRLGKGQAMNADGAGIDASGVALALLMMENSTLESTALVSQITVTASVNITFDQYVGDFFRQQKPYSSLVGDDVAIGALGALFGNVNNLNYFFKFREDTLRSKKCSTEVMLSALPEQECMNFKYQSDALGIIFPGEVIVQRNEFWGIKGGWSIPLFFKLLNENDSLVRWMNSVSGLDFLNTQLDRHFPFIEVTQQFNQIKKYSMAMPVLMSFNAINYGSFQAHIMNCMLILHQSKGRTTCSYCAKFVNDPDCKWAFKIATGVA